LTSDYVVVDKWLKKCPVTDLTQGRQLMTWVLQQKPIMTSRRVAMYVKSLYRWATNEDIALVAKNLILSFKMPKAPKKMKKLL
jgi:hypothetical protein